MLCPVAKKLGTSITVALAIGAFLFAVDAQVWYIRGWYTCSEEWFDLRSVICAQVYFGKPGLVGDQPLHIVGPFGQHVLGFCPLMPVVRMRNPIFAFYSAKACSNLARIFDLAII